MTLAGSVAVVDAGGEYSYGQLEARAARVAGKLLEGAEDLSERRIALLAAPGFDYVAAQRGIWQAGGVVVPVGLMHPPPEVQYTLDDAEVSAVIVQPALRERVASLADERGLPLWTTDELADAAPANKLPDVDPSRRAMILYTSGSTGRPKGVVTTHANIRAQVDSLVAAWDWQASDHILHVLPLHHIHGIINALGCPLRVGAVCEFLEFEAAAVWNRLAAGGITIFMAVPTIYAKLIAEFEAADNATQQQWSHGARQLRLMVSGSAALPVPTLEKWQTLTGQRLLERYGMTEIGMALSNPLQGTRRAGHVGTPLPGVEVRRTDEQGQPPADELPGEIEVRGPTVFLEYWRREQATREAFRDGWFRTGDVAVVDHGAYRILGRSNVDIIKTGGYKVSALEIEDVLRTHPAVADCAVVGVADDEWGERVAVCVVLCDSAELDLDALRAWGKQQIAAYKVPSRLITCAELPRNAMGKVQKPRVREMFEQP